MMELINTLKRLSFLTTKIIPVNSWLYRQLATAGLGLSSKARLKEKKLLSFSVSLAEHCNLNCKGCDNFSPLAEEKFLDLEIFERDCEKLSLLSNKKAEIIFLYGGEPLLHPRIIAVIESARKHFPEAIIQIITNGILLIKQTENFWDSCRDNNIEIKITKYPIDLPMQDLTQIARTHNVALEYIINIGTQIKTMWKKPLDLCRGDIKSNFIFCHQANYCTVLREGKLYPCTTVAFIEHFNKYFNMNFILSEQDFIDIHKTNNINNIFEFLCKPIPFCGYCNNKHTIYGLKWGASKKEISEWT